MRGSRASLFVTFAAAAACGSMALAEVTIRDTGRFVIDMAGKIDGASPQKVESWLKELEQKTGAQVKVVTVK